MITSHSTPMPRAPLTAPRAAVVIPCFNDGPTVTEAVQSAREQENCELVVVDDGSTDASTLAVLAELAASGMRGDPPGEPRHVGRAHGRGLGNERPVHPAAGRRRRASSGGGDRAGGRARRAARHRRGVGWADAVRRGGGAAAPAGGQSRSRRITYFNTLPYSALYRRDSLLAVGGWSLPGSFQDWDLWMALAEAGYAADAVEQPVHRYRLHGPRQFARGAARHDEIYTELRRRHPRLFADRRRNWARSSDPWRVRLAVPVAASVPGSRSAIVTGCSRSPTARARPCRGRG